MLSFLSKFLESTGWHLFETCCGDLGEYISLSLLLCFRGYGYGTNLNRSVELDFDQRREESQEAKTRSPRAEIPGTPDVAPRNDNPSSLLSSMGAIEKLGSAYERNSKRSK